MSFYVVKTPTSNQKYFFDFYYPYEGQTICVNENSDGGVDDFYLPFGYIYQTSDNKDMTDAKIEFTISNDRTVGLSVDTDDFNLKNNNAVVKIGIDGRGLTSMLKDSSRVELTLDYTESYIDEKKESHSQSRTPIKFYISKGDNCEVEEVVGDVAGGSKAPGSTS